MRSPEGTNDLGRGSFCDILEDPCSQLTEVAFLESFDLESNFILGE